MTIDVNRIDQALDSGTTGTTTCQFVVPDDAQPDDLFVVFAVAGCDNTVTSPFTGHAPIAIAGADGAWLEIASGTVTYSTDGEGTGLLSKVFWSKALTPGATVVLDCGGEETAIWCASIARVSGSATAPINAISAYAVGTNADPSTVTVASITPTADDVLLLFCITEAFMDQDDFKVCQPTGSQQAMFMASTLTSFFVNTMIAVKGADSGPTGVLASQPINKDPVESRFNPQPIALVIAIARGGCVDGTCPFVTTDGIASEAP